MSEQHVPVDDLAAYAAGDLDATAAVAVEAHLVLCDECRADATAIQHATAALAALPPVTMPADVAAQVDAALAAEPPATAPASANVLPMRRRRPSLAGLGAVAAGIALVAAIAVPTLRSNGGHTAADKGASGSTKQADARLLTSNLNYTHRNLAATLAKALAGRVAPVTDSIGAEAPGAPEPKSASGSPVPSPGVLFGGLDARVETLQTDAGHFAACVDALVGDQPVEARSVLFVDFARFEGKPAAVLGFPNVFHGAIRQAKVDVFVVGPGCGTTPGGDVLDFARMDRPPGL